MSLLNDLTVLLECQAHDEVRALFRRQLELLEHAAGEADRLGDELAGAEQRIDDLTAEVAHLEQQRAELRPLALDYLLDVIEDEPDDSDVERALRARIEAGEFGEWPRFCLSDDTVRHLWPNADESWVGSAPGNETAFKQIVDECGEVPSGATSQPESSLRDRALAAYGDEQAQRQAEVRAEVMRRRAEEQARIPLVRQLLRDQFGLNGLPDDAFYVGGVLDELLCVSVDGFTLGAELERKSGEEFYVQTAGSRGWVPVSGLADLGRVLKGAEVQ